MIDTLNTEKQNPCNRTEPQSNNTRNTTYSKHTEQRLAQQEKMNTEIIKRIMSEKKNTLPSLRNKDWKTGKAET